MRPRESDPEAVRHDESDFGIYSSDTFRVGPFDLMIDPSEREPNHDDGHEHDEVTHKLTKLERDSSDQI